jgi:ferredoxin
MTNSFHQVSFPNTDFSPLRLKPHQPLSEILNVTNSPVLFGCRTGICGTCLVTVTGTVPPPNSEEQELLDILAPDTPNARLACQLCVTHDITIQKLAS